STTRATAERRSGSGSGFCFQASSPSAGHDGPLLYRGPSEAAGGWRKARRVAGMDAGQFGVRAGCPVDKPRNPTANLAGRMPARRVSGVSFSLGYFSFGQAKEKYLTLRRRVKALLPVCSPTRVDAIPLAT